MAYREFTDSAGVLWRVWDTFPRREAGVRPQYSQGWIGFECQTERRRLAPIPKGWESATEDELWGYLSHAVVVTSSAPGRIAVVVDAAGEPVSSNDSVLARVRAVLREVDQSLKP